MPSMVGLLAIAIATALLGCGSATSTGVTGSTGTTGLPTTNTKAAPCVDGTMTYQPNDDIPSGSPCFQCYCDGTTGAKKCTSPAVCPRIGCSTGETPITVPGQCCSQCFAIPDACPQAVSLADGTSQTLKVNEQVKVSDCEMAECVVSFTAGLPRLEITRMMTPCPKTLSCPVGTVATAVAGQCCQSCMTPPTGKCDASTPCKTNQMCDQGTCRDVLAIGDGCTPAVTGTISGPVCETDAACVQRADNSKDFICVKGTSCRAVRMAAVSAGTVLTEEHSCDANGDFIPVVCTAAGCWCRNPADGTAADATAKPVPAADKASLPCVTKPPPAGEVTLTLDMDSATTYSDKQVEDLRGYLATVTGFAQDRFVYDRTASTTKQLVLRLAGGTAADQTLLSNAVTAARATSGATTGSFTVAGLKLADAAVTRKTNVCDQMICTQQVTGPQCATKEFADGSASVDVQFADKCAYGKAVCEAGNAGGAYSYVRPRDGTCDYSCSAVDASGATVDVKEGAAMPMDPATPCMECTCSRPAPICKPIAANCKTACAPGEVLQDVKGQCCGQCVPVAACTTDADCGDKACVPPCVGSTAGPQCVDYAATGEECSTSGPRGPCDAKRCGPKDLCLDAATLLAAVSASTGTTAATGSGAYVPPVTKCVSMDACVARMQMGDNVFCQPDGSYLPVQCDSSTMKCMCVDDQGMPEAGTKTMTMPPSRPDPATIAQYVASLGCKRPMIMPPVPPLPPPMPPPPTTCDVVLAGVSMAKQVGGTWADPAVPCQLCECLASTAGLPPSVSCGKPKQDCSQIRTDCLAKGNDYELRTVTGQCCPECIKKQVPTCTVGSMSYVAGQSYDKGCSDTCMCMDDGTWSCSTKKTVAACAADEKRVAVPGSTCKFDCVKQNVDVCQADADCGTGKYCGMSCGSSVKQCKAYIAPGAKCQVKGPACSAGRVAPDHVCFNPMPATGDTQDGLCLPTSKLCASDVMAVRAAGFAADVSCTDDGEYTEVQCKADKSECWCVDSAGSEISLTRAQTTTPNCNPSNPVKPPASCNTFAACPLCKVSDSSAKQYCGKDGVTYSDCELKAKACSSCTAQADLVDYDGPCRTNTKEGMPCSPCFATTTYQRCEGGSRKVTSAGVCTYNAQLQCMPVRAPCPPPTKCDFDCDTSAKSKTPVCGSNGVTYDSACDLLKAACSAPTDAIRQFATGACNLPTAVVDPATLPATVSTLLPADTCDSCPIPKIPLRKCADGVNWAGARGCKVTKNGCQPNIVTCPGTDDDVYMPTPNIDFTTLIPTPEETTKIIAGIISLPGVSTVTNSVAPATGTTVAPPAPAVSCPTSCAVGGTQLCASDGESYENACVMEQLSCATGTTLRKLYDGKCVTTCVRDLVQATRAAAALVDGYYPSCTSTGLYAVRQASLKEAWCVDPTSGVEVAGSRVAVATAADDMCEEKPAPSAANPCNTVRCAAGSTCQVEKNMDAATAAATPTVATCVDTTAKALTCNQEALTLCLSKQRNLAASATTCGGLSLNVDCAVGCGCSAWTSQFCGKKDSKCDIASCTDVTTAEDASAGDEPGERACVENAKCTLGCDCVDKWVGCAADFSVPEKLESYCTIGYARCKDQCTAVTGTRCAPYASANQVSDEVLKQMDLPFAAPAGRSGVPTMLVGVVVAAVVAVAVAAAIVVVSRRRNQQLEEPLLVEEELAL